MPTSKKTSAPAKKKPVAVKAEASKPTAKKPAAKKTAVTKAAVSAGPKLAAAVKPTAAKLSPSEFEHSIRVRAYEIYLSGRNGDHLADWLEAEAQLRA